MDSDETRRNWFPLVNDVMFGAMSTCSQIECERVLYLIRWNASVDKLMHCVDYPASRINHGDTRCIISRLPYMRLMTLQMDPKDNRRRVWENGDQGNFGYSISSSATRLSGSL